LLMKSEALADLRKLLENEQASPVRFSRTAKLMVADIKPLAGMPLVSVRLDYRPEHAQVLGKIKTLKTVNGEPAEKYLAEAKK